ncbi:MAG: hypothetical protein A3D16_17830 [Rhodobacterales bacterium RIFCSPHIGHO2_02_FULL_62_130]|jgi:biotin synthase-like enzyme|nr:MAG: hypothetical protein A3D16_17830 [Rhodobacterales bacterium RIFCSPHIGHO2_02_FULL_62_130]OHC53388.1 MAG: hypothetical protein A3E48_18825 [Rhodobacterales bacterium RIFCSPHIGHO2_12_FULL_62_75]HCY98432.1 hypothetical protein [Rhodobacter sp.]
MDLIIGTRHITPDAMIRTATGIEAVLHGEALMSPLNAAFHGARAIKILDGDLDRHRMEATGIKMRGRETRVTLAAMGAVQRLM